MRTILIGTLPACPAPSLGEAGRPDSGLWAWDGTRGRTCRQSAPDDGGSRRGISSARAGRSDWSRVADTVAVTGPLKTASAAKPRTRHAALGTMTGTARDVRGRRRAAASPGR